MATILIIEDETSLIELYAEILESGGFTVLKASDGEEGLKIAREQDWDLLFLDIILPKLDGVAVLREIKAGDETADRPVVMLTNLESHNVIVECLQLGASEYLSKATIEPKKILDIAHKYLG